MEFLPLERARSLDNCWRRIGAEMFDHATGDFPLAHDGDIGAEMGEMLYFVIGMCAADAFDRTRLRVSSRNRIAGSSV